MIKVYVNKQSNYPVSAPNIKKKLKSFLVDEGIVSDARVDLFLVGKERMLDLAESYLGEKGVLHNVLSFPATEIKGEFVYPPGELLHLGEILVCYPKAFEEAQEEGISIEKKVTELVLHGAEHLMGKHHE
jgi:probable rRNA maturation factor